MSIRLRSLIPERDILKVLGIGVALSEIQCAFGAISLNFSF